jgi:FkbM family methyltransferase
VHEATNKAVRWPILTTRHGPLFAGINDVAYNADGSAYGVGHDLLTKSCYEPEHVELFCNILRSRRTRCGDGVVALDIGANIGVFTVEMARLMSGWGSVISYEPQELLFYALCANILLNNLDSNTKAVYAAVGGRAGKIRVPRLNFEEKGSYGSLELKGENTDLGQKLTEQMDLVPIVAIDDLELPRIDFMKIDVEGMELDVLVGATRTINRLHPILYVEHNKAGTDKLRAYLERLDYFIVAYGPNFLCTAFQDTVAIGAF